MFAPKSASLNNKKHFDKIALIDADKMKHLVAYDVANDLKMNMTRQPNRLAMFIEERIAGIFNQFSAKGYIFCFSGKSHNTFRSKIAIEKEYKGNRKDDPSYYEGKIEDMAEVVKVVMKSFPSLIFNDLEADDILCFLQNDDTFIFSNDKDLNQIPGYHFDMNTKDLIVVSEEDAYRNLCYQMIVGDTTDNIPGLKGYGPVKAKKLMAEVPIKKLINHIHFTYQQVYGLTNGTDAFTETWNLVKLRPSRGTYFLEKYKEAKELLDLMIINSK
jgi:DNA polymerase-1